MLELLLKELPKDQATFNQLYATEQYDALKAAVHRLHGACCYCNVPELKNKMAHLEQALHQSEIKQLKPLLVSVNQEIDRLLNQALQNNAQEKA